ARYVVLSPGKASYETELDGKAHQLPAGSHAIVPVDEEAAGHLGQLVDRLRWLSPDTEAAVLNILRRPSLDMRLSRIERTVFGKTTDEALAGGMLARLKENLPLATFAMTLLLWILVSINSMLLLGRPSKTNAAEQSTHTETTQTTDAKTDSATGTARSSAQDPLPIVEAAKPLLEQLYAKKENGAWKPFYKTHFSAVPSATPSDDQIGHLFQDPAFLWGLVKLQAMALGADSKDPAFIQKKDDKAAIKRALQSLGNEKILSRSSVFARLTSMLEGKPSAPDFSPVPFTTDKDEVFTDRDLADGLPALAEFLEHAP
ncbi:MAG: hypothetical protein JOZ54_07565, partial [Acidobacteria bacterium]|nr:hypothetical protein [Acidobacteriota bacterium]